MKFNRREFLTLAAGSAVAAGAVNGPVSATTGDAASANGSDSYGMLVDTTQCIGCRKCEWACANANKCTDKPVEAYEDTSVFETFRRMKPNAYTVVNSFKNGAELNKPIFVKTQCMHCLRPACASACIVGALRRQDTGAVTYDAWKCMGCRYCMVACPFQTIAYQYDNAFTPVVTKCTFCYENFTKDGKPPACAAICPPMCLTFAKRSELLQLAHERIADKPGQYVDHIYGEHEVGGTAWMYLTPKPAVELGMLELGDTPVPQLTETIQHSVFKFGVPPLLLYGLLAITMKSFRRHDPALTHADEKRENT